MTTLPPSPSRPTGESAVHAEPVAPAIPAELRAALLDVARAALVVATGVAAATTLAASIRKAARPGLRAAVFVTLTSEGDLRGCMGTLDEARPIADAVAAAAMTAGIDDPRFSPVDVAELEGLWLDVSILGPTVALGDPGEFVPGLDGIVVEHGWRRGLLLPEVATGHGWDGERMLTAVCEKAGLPADAWRDPETRCLVFRTRRFGGPVVPGRARA